MLHDIMLGEIMITFQVEFIGMITLQVETLIQMHGDDEMIV